jgi:hypothetical protein
MIQVSYTVLCASYNFSKNSLSHNSHAALVHESHSRVAKAYELILYLLYLSQETAEVLNGIYSTRPTKREMHQS